MTVTRQRFDFNTSVARSDTGPPAWGRVVQARWERTGATDTGSDLQIWAQQREADAGNGVPIADDANSLGSDFVRQWRSPTHNLVRQSDRHRRRFRRARPSRRRTPARPSHARRQRGQWPALRVDPRLSRDHYRNHRAAVHLPAALLLLRHACRSHRASQSASTRRHTPASVRRCRLRTFLTTPGWGMEQESCPLAEQAANSELASRCGVRPPRTPKGRSNREIAWVTRDQKPSPWCLRANPNSSTLHDADPSKIRTSNAPRSEHSQFTA